MAQSKSKEVVEILKTAADDREAENKLVMLLGVERFEFIKLLRQHRQMILYCTLRMQAQTSGEKKKIEQTMSADNELSGYLRALQDTDEGDIVGEERARRKEVSWQYTLFIID